MKRLMIFGLFFLSFSVLAAQDNKPDIGINLTGIADWSTQYPFADAFKTARPWISQREGAAWGEGGALALTEEGWVAALEEGQYAETLFFSHTPALAQGMEGNYTLLYEGSGTLTVSGSGVITSEEAGRIMIAAKPSQGSIFLQLRATDPQNPIRAMRLYLPDTNASMTFNPLFLERIQPFTVLRFMDWMNTNNSTLVAWEDRPKVTDAFWSEKGVPVEIMVQLANTLGADAWFNMPHAANDTYINEFAAYVAANLDRSLTAYVEYSNETWNGQFQQANYVSEQGLTLNLAAGDGFWSGLRYHSKRAVEIFAIWEQAMGSERLVRVLASQAANNWTAEQVADFEGAAQQADAIAIAPYFSCDDPANPASIETVIAAGVEGLLNNQLTNVREGGCAYAYVTANLEIARRYNLDLVAYEGGQHLAGYGGSQNNDALTSLFITANRNPRMKDIYTEYLANWVALGGGTFMAFADVGEYTRFGSWGLLETLTQDPTTAPKYQALVEFIGS